MKLSGELLPAPFLRLCFSNEYQFEVLFEYSPNTPILRCAFYKGEYFLTKITLEAKEMQFDHFVIDDQGSLRFCENPTLRGIIEYFTEKETGLLQGELAFGRGNISHVLLQVIEIWVGKLQEVTSINIVQPGRNGIVSPDGKFDLSPRKQDWKN